METPGSLEVENADSLLVAEVPSGLLRVAIVDGGVSTVASGDLLAAATAVAIGPGGTVYVTDAAGFVGGTSEVVEVDPSNGNQSSVSLGGDLLVPLAVAVERSGTILVADVGTLAAGTNKILRIDPGDSGSQSPLASGKFIADFLSDVEVGRFGEIYVGARSEGLIAVDPTTGAQTLLVGVPSVDNANAIAVVPPETIKVEDFENGIGDWTEVVPP